MAIQWHILFIIKAKDNINESYSMKLSSKLRIATMLLFMNSNAIHYLVTFKK